MKPVVPPLATASPTAPFTALTVPSAGATSVVSSTPFSAVETATCAVTMLGLPLPRCRSLSQATRRARSTRSSTSDSSAAVSSWRWAVTIVC